MRSSRDLLLAAPCAALVAGAAAGAHSAAAYAQFFSLSFSEALTAEGAYLVLTDFTAWCTAVALVVTVAVSRTAIAGRHRGHWMAPSLTCTVLLALWTAAAWLDGTRAVSAAALDGSVQATWVTWPGIASPRGWLVFDAPEVWALDLLSATGPVIVLVAVWTGPVLLRVTGSRTAGGCGGAPARGDTARLSGADASDPLASVLATEARRATSVAAGATVLLCTAVVLLQGAGGASAVLSPAVGTRWMLLDGPAVALVVAATGVAWVVGRSSSGSALVPSSAPTWTASAVLMAAVALVALLRGPEPDLLMLAVGGIGVLTASARGVVAEGLTTVLLGAGTCVNPGRGASTAGATAPADGVLAPSATQPPSLSRAP